MYFTDTFSQFMSLHFLNSVLWRMNVFILFYIIIIMEDGQEDCKFKCSLGNLRTSETLPE